MGARAAYAVAVPDMYFACTQLLNLVVAPASPPSVSESPLQEKRQRGGKCKVTSLHGFIGKNRETHDPVLGGLAGQQTQPSKRLLLGTSC